MCLLLGIFIFSSGCARKVPTADFLHPQFAERRTNFNVVVMVEPHVEIVRMAYRGGKTPLSNETSQVSQLLPGLVAEQLRQLGITMASAGTNASAGVSAEAAAAKLTEARGKLEEWMGAPSQSMHIFVPTNTTEVAAAAARTLGENIGAQAVLLVTLGGKLNSGSRSIREAAVLTLGSAGALAVAPFGAVAAPGAFVVVGGSAWLVTGAGKVDEFMQGAAICAVLVDATTGELLWANTRSGDFRGKQLGKLVKLVFREFPK